MCFLFLVLKMFPKRNTNDVFQFQFMYRKNQFANNRIFANKFYTYQKYVKCSIQFH